MAPILAVASRNTSASIGSPSRVGGQLGQLRSSGQRVSAQLPLDAVVLPVGRVLPAPQCFAFGLSLGLRVQRFRELKRIVCDHSYRVMHDAVVQ